MSVSFNNNNNNTAPKYDAHAFAVTIVPASESKKNSSALSGGFAMQLFRPFRSVSFTSPRTVMLGGCVELMVLLYFFSQVRILEGDYFRWGVPLVLFQYEITGTNEFLCILAVFFLHQITYTWITETLNPWLLNEVQDHKCSSIRYTKPTTVSVINLYQAYLTLNNILVLNIAFSQVSFLVIILVADFISHTLINLRYIWHKNVISDTPQKKESDIEAQLLEFKNGYCPIPDPYTLKVVVSKP